MADLLAYVAVAALVAVHFLASRVRRIPWIPRSRWLSFAGGVSVAFVFLELLPSLARASDAIGGEHAEGALVRVVPYVVALAGLALFYGVERAVRADAPDAEGTSTGVFWGSMVAFALLNLVAGYLLVEEERHPLALVLFALALALHFVVADRGLREDHKRDYDRVGRPAIVAAFVAGAAVGVLAAVPEAWLHAFTAFLTGGILLNTVKEELPSERASRWSAFAVGAALYAALYLGAKWLG